MFLFIDIKGNDFANGTFKNCGLLMAFWSSLGVNAWANPCISEILIAETTRVDES